MKIPVLLFAVLILTPFVRAQERVNKPQLAQQVRSEFLHAWTGYKKYAWGHDDLKPLTKTYHDWYAEPLLMTPVDALDTMILMGLNDEAKTTRAYIDKNLSFDKDIEVQNFEITIRLLGGLLSSYQLTGDEKLLKLAEDLGNRLLPVFESPTGLPYRYVTIRGIEEDEWRHRKLVGEMLASLGAGPSKRREVRATIIGCTLGLLCHVTGWLAPMYGAGKLESGNVREYETAARYARDWGCVDLIDGLLEMAEVEWEHELYFRSRVLSHPLGRRLPLWPQPPPKETIRLSHDRVAGSAQENSPAASGVVFLN